MTSEGFKLYNNFSVKSHSVRIPIQKTIGYFESRIRAILLAREADSSHGPVWPAWNIRFARELETAMVFLGHATACGLAIQVPPIVQTFCAQYKDVNERLHFKCAPGVLALLKASRESTEVAFVVPSYIKSWWKDEIMGEALLPQDHGYAMKYHDQQLATLTGQIPGGGRADSPPREREWLGHDLLALAAAEVTPDCPRCLGYRTAAMRAATSNIEMFHYIRASKTSFLGMEMELRRCMAGYRVLAFNAREDGQPLGDQELRALVRASHGDIDPTKPGANDFGNIESSTGSPGITMSNLSLADSLKSKFRSEQASSASLSGSAMNTLSAERPPVGLRAEYLVPLATGNGSKLAKITKWAQQVEDTSQIKPSAEDTAGEVDIPQTIPPAETSADARDKSKITDLLPEEVFQDAMDIDPTHAPRSDIVHPAAGGDATDTMLSQPAMDVGVDYIDLTRSSNSAIREPENPPVHTATVNIPPVLLQRYADHTFIGQKFGDMPIVQLPPMPVEIPSTEPVAVPKPGGRIQAQKRTTFLNPVNTTAGPSDTTAAITHSEPAVGSSRPMHSPVSSSGLLTHSDSEFSKDATDDQEDLFM